VMGVLLVFVPLRLNKRASGKAFPSRPGKE
jgi:hypothetical protein